MGSLKGPARGLHLPRAVAVVPGPTWCLGSLSWHPRYPSLPTHRLWGGLGHRTLVPGSVWVGAGPGPLRVKGTNEGGTGTKGSGKPVSKTRHCLVFRDIVRALEPLWPQCYPSQP